jgi:glyoxylase-like metal-dependent hydrolase (beta-lactamase superfamily II)
VFFRRSDVVASGDLFQTTTYPVIDVARGGSVQGIINGLNRLLDITIPKDKAEGGTYVVPGHGRLSDEADVVEYRDMLTIVRDRIQDLIAAGKVAGRGQSCRPDPRLRRSLWLRPLVHGRRISSSRPSTASLHDGSRRPGTSDVTDFKREIPAKPGH